MPAISIQHVTKLFDSGRSSASADGLRTAAVDDVSLDVEQGEIVVLLGPSGCGKTTLMRMVNRLIEPTSGEIFVDGREIHQIPATELRRHIGYVIQQVGLFPHMTVAQNIAVVPKLLGWNKDRTQKRIDELLDLVSLAPSEFRRRYPRQLSGGQQQRVGIARAMAGDPAVLLMDEPFGAIDAITRTALQNELLTIHHQVNKTIVFVTHDVEEALRLADQIAVMRAGKIVQFDKPHRLLSSPSDDFVSSLLGTSDVFRQLSVVPVSEIMSAPSGDRNGAVTVSSADDARSVLSHLIANGVDVAAVMDSSGQRVGSVTLTQILTEGARDAAPSTAAR